MLDGLQLIGGAYFRPARRALLGAYVTYAYVAAPLDTEHVPLQLRLQEGTRVALGDPEVVTQVRRDRERKQRGVVDIPEPLRGGEARNGPGRRRAHRKIEIGEMRGCRKARGGRGRDVRGESSLARAALIEGNEVVALEFPASEDLHGIRRGPLEITVVRLEGVGHTVRTQADL